MFSGRIFNGHLIRTQLISGAGLAVPRSSGLSPRRRPRPTQKEKNMAPSATFWDKIAEKYAKQPVSDEAAYQKKLEVTQSYFSPEMEVLEIGCGTGTTSLIHAPFVKHIRATDISQNMIAICKRKAEAQNIANVTFEQATAEDLTVPDGTMDVVMAHSLLHLLEDKEAMMAKVFRMLKPGGLFVTNTVCLGDRMWYMAPLLPIMRLFGFAPLVKVFTVKHLVQTMKEGGYEIDHQWQPDKSIGVFIVAKKPG